MAKPPTLPPFPDSDPQAFGFHAAQATAGAAGDLAFPGLGYVLQRVIGRYAGDPLERRREQWFKDLATALESLRNTVDGLDPETWAESETFASAVYEATHMAMKTHLEEKREALRNTVLNVAAGQTINETLRGRFMRLVDTLSPGHLMVLRIMNDPMPNAEFAAAAERVSAGSPVHLLEQALRGSMTREISSTSSSPIYLLND